MRVEGRVLRVGSWIVLTVEDLEGFNAFGRLPDEGCAHAAGLQRAQNVGVGRDEVSRSAIEVLNEIDFGMKGSVSGVLVHCGRQELELAGLRLWREEEGCDGPISAGSGDLLPGWTTGTLHAGCAGVGQVLGDLHPGGEGFCTSAREFSGEGSVPIPMLIPTAEVHEL